MTKLLYACGHVQELGQLAKDGGPPPCATCAEPRLERVINDRPRFRGLPIKENNHASR